MKSRYTPGRNEDDDFDPEDLASSDGKRLTKQSRRLIKQWRAESFRCVRCGADISLEAAGSDNRNHCPLCLWSRHVDESIGDRKATCLSGMEAVALTRKHGDGELMLVHVCRGCGKVSKNRLAGDDNAYSVYQLYVESCKHTEALQENTGLALCGPEEEGVIKEELALT